MLPTETSEMVAVAVSPEVLDRYTGTYRLDARQTLTFTRRGNELIGNRDQDGMLGLFTLEAQSDTRFFSRAADAILTFARVADGKSPSVVVRRDGREATAQRVE